MSVSISKKTEEFFTKFKHQTYKKGEILIRADDAPSGVFYIQKGNVKEYAISKKGDELVLNIFKQHAFFPMSWAINQTHNPYYFEALTDVEVYKAPRESVVEYVLQNPDVLYDLLSRVFRGTDGMLTRLTHLLSGNAYARLISELVIQAKRFGEKKGNAIDLSVSEKDLAAESGLTRETISRELKSLKDKGLVIFHAHILEIPDLLKLEEELLSAD